INSNTMNLLVPRATLNCKEIDLFRFLVNWGKKQQSLNSNSNSSFKDIIKPYLQYIRFPLINSHELIREVRPLGVMDDIDYIQTLEFNSDKEFFSNRNKLQNNS